MPSRGFAVNNQDRNDVVAFWQAVYQASEGYEKRVKWSGDYAGNNGATSAEFTEDIERRLNYFRAMCGIPSDARVSSNSTVVIESTDAYKPSSNTLKATAAQNAALMLARNYNPVTGANLALSHFPSAGLVGWSSTSWNANSKGNFAFGLYGPGAISEYMVEQLSKSAATSSWNSLVGHRRWNLFPRATSFASGDQPGASAAQPPSNVFYVVQKESEMIDEEATPRFVAYPSAGFFPAKINSPFWSLSCHGANFSAAAVKMTDAAGNAVPIIATRRSNDYGDPAVVWEVDPSVSVQTVAKDTLYNVKVSGISGENVPETWSYAVTLIDPDILTSNQKIAGGSSQKSTVKAAYTFVPPVGSEGVQVVASRRTAAKWKETAESASSSLVIDRTGGNYALIVNPSTFAGFGPVAGKCAFHLTFPVSYDLIARSVPDQIFELDHEVIASSKGVISFQYRRGYMTKNSFLAVEASKDGGVTWKAVGAALGRVRHPDGRVDFGEEIRDSQVVITPAPALPLLHQGRLDLYPRGRAKVRDRYFHRRNHDDRLRRIVDSESNYLRRDDQELHAEFHHGGEKTRRRRQVGPAPPQQAWREMVPHGAAESRDHRRSLSGRAVRLSRWLSPSPKPRPSRLRTLPPASALTP